MNWDKRSPVEAQFVEKRTQVDRAIGLGHITDL
jgi:hypothetical protein